MKWLALVLLTACADVAGPSIPDAASSALCPCVAPDSTRTIVITVTLCPDCP